MEYRIIVYKAADTIEQVYDRTFRFSESSHKVVDVFEAALRQIELEGGELD